MLAPPDGGKRVLIFIILTICSDIGGYFAGITLTPFTGGHKMAPVISPKKTWEGLAGSALLAVVAGAILLPALLHGHWWQGVITGIAAVAAAVFGDLAESMIKRDLDDQGHGHPAPRPRRHPRPHRLPARLRPGGLAAARVFRQVKKKKRSKKEKFKDKFVERPVVSPTPLLRTPAEGDPGGMHGGQQAPPAVTQPVRDSMRSRSCRVAGSCQRVAKKMRSQTSASP